MAATSSFRFFGARKGRPGEPLNEVCACCGAHLAVRVVFLRNTEGVVRPFGVDCAARAMGIPAPGRKEKAVDAFIFAANMERISGLPQGTPDDATERIPSARGLLPFAVLPGGVIRVHRTGMVTDEAVNAFTAQGHTVTWAFASGTRIWLQLA